MPVLQLPADSAESLAPHRTRPGWELCYGVGVLWLRIPDDSASLEAAASLPALARYQVDRLRRLIPFHATLPTGREPDGPWQALGEVLTVLPPPALFPGRMGGGFPVGLVRSSSLKEPAALLAPLSVLLGWAENAPRPRLRSLVFAAAPDGRVFVRGTPLPPVPGTAFYFQSNLALPCGWDFAPPLRADWVAQSLAVPVHSTVLLTPENGAVEISQESFVPLTLAALRRTRDNLKSAASPIAST
ncbi:MAG: hypothetical protein JWL81_1585 [Verrucomicrobiales bacterium]|nr:hypothetical protein [Verrucomicrobiales bacterium]